MSIPGHQHAHHHHHHDQAQDHGHGHEHGHEHEHEHRGLPAPEHPEDTGPRRSPYLITRRRLDDRPWAPLKIASGCDRRCTFCAIPSFRGSFVSRPADDIVAEAAWLADQGVREVMLVSENSTSYGKDLGDLGALEKLLPRLATQTGLDRIRVSYLQPAEIRPALVEAMSRTDRVMPYFDLSFQHASPTVLRRMRRFGSTEAFLGLLAEIRAMSPAAGIRSNVIVGFPGETEQDLAELEAFLIGARLDAVGVFGYSDEDGTSAAELPNHIHPQDIEDRRQRISALVEELTARRAQERLGERVEVLVEEHEVLPEQPEQPSEHGRQGSPLVRVLGRAGFQGPEVDGVCELISPDATAAPVGSLVSGTVVETDGVDLLVETS
jgi:ribosomal protein S12 methylthiotransferase